jgi:hypothetical protein
MLLKTSIDFITGLQASFMAQGGGSRITDDEAKVEELSSGIDTLAIGMAGWLGLMTVASLVIFVIVWKRLGKNDKEDTDAEAGSVQSSSDARSSIVDFSLFPSLRDADLGTPEKSNMDTEELPDVHTP